MKGCRPGKNANFPREYHQISLQLEMFFTNFDITSVRPSKKHKFPQHFPWNKIPTFPIFPGMREGQIVHGQSWDTWI